jgi:hypothetical protein
MTSRQHPSRFILVAGALALGLVMGACGGGTGANTGDGGQHDGAPPNCTQPSLFLVSPQAVTLSAQAQTELKVRYSCDSQPYSGMLVDFAIVGDGKGSALSSASSQTDAAGEAAVTLTAGTQSATFEVRASAAGAAALTFSITINTANVGTISVTMHYTGATVFTEFKAYLFQNKQCTAIDAFAITGALQEAAAVAVISAKPQFISVPAGTGYTVAVTAKKGADILGFGCTPSINVTAGAKTDTDVTIEDIPISYNGVYDLDNHFDMTGLLPPSVGNIIHIFDELSDDHEKSGAPCVPPHCYGEDPFAFILDFVYRQICKWECTNANPDYANCTPGTHPYGDLEKLYTQNFQTWDGAQPLNDTWGLCGGLEIAHPFIQDQLWTWAQGAPTWLNIVLRIIDIAGDLARAIDQMHITSKLTLNDIRPGRQGNFSHVLETMIVDLHHLDGTLHSYPVDLVAAGIGTLSYSGNTTVTNDKLQIPSHTFTLKFGKLVQYIYINYALPALGYSSTVDLLQDLVNCASVGDWLADKIGIFSDTEYENYCNLGLTAAGTWIENSIPNWITADTDFTLQGVAAAAEVDSRRVATKLDGTPPTTEEGWAGHWVEGSANANFTGTFTGVRE